MLSLYEGIAYQIKKACVGGWQERLAKAHDYTVGKCRVRRGVGGEGNKASIRAQSPSFFISGERPLSSLSQKEFADNSLVDSQINCQYGQTKGPERA